MSSAPPLLSRTILGVLASCLLLAGCADASKTVASENQAALSSSTTQPSTSAVSSTTMPPATSTSSTSTLPSEMPSAEDIFAERSSQLAGDESAPDNELEPDIQLINFLLNLLSQEAPNAPTPEWLTQQQITQLSNEVNALPAELVPELIAKLTNYMEMEEICADSMDSQVEMSKCSPVFLEICENFRILGEKLENSEVSSLRSLWFDLSLIVCYISDSIEFLVSAGEVVQNCSDIWRSESFSEIFPVKSFINQSDLKINYILPTQDELEQSVEQFQECVNNFGDICLEVTDLTDKVNDLPIWILPNENDSTFDEFFSEARDVPELICQLASFIESLGDILPKFFAFSETCQDINPFESEQSDEPRSTKLSMSNTNTTIFIQQNANEELLDKCYEILQDICTDLNSLVKQLEEVAEIDEEFDNLVELHSSVETIYCNLADIFSQE